MPEKTSPTPARKPLKSRMSLKKRGCDARRSYKTALPIRRRPEYWTPTTPRCQEPARLPTPSPWRPAHGTSSLSRIGEELGRIAIFGTDRTRPARVEFVDLSNERLPPFRGHLADRFDLRVTR